MSDTTPMKQIVQLPLDQRELVMLCDLASIGASFLRHCQHLGAGRQEEAEASTRVMGVIGGIALARLGPEYTWQIWGGIADRIDRLQRAAFPAAPPIRIGEGWTKPTANDGDPQ